MSKNKTNKSKLRKKLTKKFRLVVLNEDSFEERFSFKLTRLNVFVLSGVFSVFLVGITVLIIAFTPIKEYIPGFSSTKLKKQATDLFYKVDSLQEHLIMLDKFTSSLRPVLIGEKDTLNAQLPYIKAIQTEAIVSKAKNIANDSVGAVIAAIQTELDNTYKEYYRKEKFSLEQEYAEREDTLVAKYNTEVEKLKTTEEKAIALDVKIEELQKQLVSEKKELTELKKKLALKEVEKKYPSSSSSKDNEVKRTLAVQKIIEKEFLQKEQALIQTYEKQLALFRDTLLLKNQLIDTLERSVVLYQRKKIGELSDELPFNEVSPLDEKLLERSNLESVFREGVEREDRFSLFDFESNKVDLVFFEPVKGVITEGYSVKEKHYAVDIAVTKGTAVKSVADGVVIFAEWTSETGYVLIIEHANRYLSVYKHNEILYRSQGDLVQSGEVISVAGSSGEYSTGPHLHFEMWHKGYPVNPINFIEFE